MYRYTFREFIKSVSLKDIKYYTNKLKRHKNRLPFREIGGCPEPDKGVRYFYEHSVSRKRSQL